MKLIANFTKTFKENIRDWKIIILVIVFAPFFVYLMNMYLGNSGTSVYHIALLNHDEEGIFAKDLIREWKEIKTDENSSILNIIPVINSDAGKKMIIDRTADLFITIPRDFSASFNLYIQSKKGMLSALTSYGDPKNIRTIMAASFVDYTTYNFIGFRTGIQIPFNIQFETAGVQKKIRDFDLYVPTMLVLAIIMMLFTAGASIIREVEKETITRLSLSKLSSFEFMTAISLNQILIGIASLVLTLLAAYTVGFKTEGSIALLLLTGIITCFSVVSISIITTCFIRSMFGLLTIGCFPFFLLMFFSDCFMPLPKINLVNLFDNPFFLNDILPTATAVRVFNKVLNYDAGIGDISFELIWMTLLSGIYFVAGVLLFRRKYKY